MPNWPFPLLLAKYSMSKAARRAEIHPPQEQRVRLCRQNNGGALFTL